MINSFEFRIPFAKIYAYEMLGTKTALHLNNDEELLKLIEVKCSMIIIDRLKDPNTTFADIRTTLAINIAKYIDELTGRRPLVLPIITDIRK